VNREQEDEVGDEMKAKQMTMRLSRMPEAEITVQLPADPRSPTKLIVHTFVGREPRGLVFVLDDGERRALVAALSRPEDSPGLTREQWGDVLALTEASRRLKSDATDCEDLATRAYLALNRAGLNPTSVVAAAPRECRASRPTDPGLSEGEEYTCRRPRE
jgi:hypothetical protein